MSWWDNFWRPVKPELVSEIINGNYIEGELYRAKAPNGKGIIYCHGGFADALTPDVQVYVKAGYHLLHIDYENEGNLAGMDPNRNITEVKDSITLLRNNTGVENIYFVGVSHGGYLSMLVFAYNSPLIKKIVDYIGPLNFYDPPYDWSSWGTDPKHAAMIEAGKAYFGKTKDPYTLAKEGKYTGLADRILLLYGEKDPICPYLTMGVPFKDKVGCKLLVFPKLTHNVHRDAQAQQIALRWLAK